MSAIENIEDWILRMVIRVTRYVNLRVVLYSAKSACWKIVDYGLKSVENSSYLIGASNARGKPGYRAPELLDERLTDTKSSDIWALGCILCELCDGKKPFADDLETREFAIS